MKIRPIVIRLALLRRAVRRLAKTLYLLPQSIAINFKDRPRQLARDAAEAERLDRIRNPSDYRGK